MRNKILIADTSKASRDIVKNALGEKYTILETESARAAFEMIKKESDMLAAVIFDADLPHEDAFAVTKAMAKESFYGSFPIIIVSTQDSTELQRKAYFSGATLFAHKIFDAELLEIMISRQIKSDSQGNTTRTAAGEDAKGLEDMHANLIELVGKLVEFRNPESHNHVRRVKGLTKIMAETMATLYPEYGLDSHRIRVIVSACALHDIGKIAIPDSVILKPGRLTDDEYEYMKSHTLRGIELLDSIDGVWDKEFEEVVREVVRSHHEKYDGGGYPDGLKGDDIPISAQIISLADTYDALVNDRIYKKAYPKDVAFNKIIVGDCGQFPPKIIECFKASRARMEAWENGELDLGTLK